MQYVSYILEQDSVKQALEDQKSSMLEIFKDSFSVKNVYKEVNENLTYLINKDDVAATYSNIREFAQNLTLSYLNNKTKEIAESN